MDFKDRLKDLRLSNNLTQINVSSQIGLSERNYQRLESGCSKPKFETIIKLADFFGVSTDYLLCRTNNPEILK